MLLFFGCSDPDNLKPEIVFQEDFSSPDVRLIANIAHETYFNTTGYDKHLSLRLTNQVRPYPGNIWHFGGGDLVAVSWTSPTNLLVRYYLDDPNTRSAVPSSTNLLGVSVSFQLESDIVLLEEAETRRSKALKSP